jgi:type II secretory pathway component PulF
MTTYRVRAIDGEGRVAVLTEDAPSEAALEGLLARRGFAIAQLREVAANAHSRRIAKGLGAAGLADFTERLDILYSSGLPIVDCLAEIERGAASDRLREIAARIRSDLESGASLSAALARFPRAFPSAYRAAVLAAERSGALDEVLKRLAGQIEWSRNARATMVQALIYPAILLLAILGLLVLLFTFLLPRIAEFFRDSQTALPGPTQVVLAISDFLLGHGLVIAMSFALLGVGIALALRVPRGARFLHGLLLRVPLVGPLLRRAACARFVATLGMLHHAGTPLTEALEASREATGNAALAHELESVVSAVYAGEPLTVAMERSRGFESIVLRMIAAGEASGSLSQALGHALRLLDRDVARGTKRLLALAEPLILIVAGVVVGFVVFATILPIFRMLGTIR